MGKTLGLDLGTNSIGWAIRDTDTESENQIIDFGVVAFEKGVGDGKSGEFSLAAERRKNRSKRRLYNAKRYRKWATLKVLRQNCMCPISDEELRLWSIGDWENYGKNKGRSYPSSPDFKAWLAMDFERIGKEVSEDIKLKPAFDNTYLLRCMLLEKFDEDDKLRQYKIGRVMYHLVQRRGFKTSRKSGKSSFAKNEELEKLKEEKPDIQIAQVLQNKLKTENKRIRASGVIQRKYFEDEFYAISNKQKLSEDLTNKLYKAIYYVRPLRTQKGLVGKCTLEKGKPRIPISHPAFEEFRALSFINNIQWRETGSKKSMEQIPFEIKKKILEQIFFRKREKGKNKGRVDDRTYFKFDEIIEEFSENGKWEFNYRNKPNVSTCSVIAGLMNVFDDDWKNKFIEDENKIGINWEGLSLIYTVKYGKKEGEQKKLDYKAIWHLLFDYIQTKDKEEELRKFCKEVLEWKDENKINLFADINIPQGYGSLSFSAIEKIIPYLQQGYIYSEAVSFANLSKVLGKENFEKKKSEITYAITQVIKETDEKKEKLNIVNGLVQQYFAETRTNRAKGVDNTIKEIAADDVENKLKGYFGEDNWKEQAEKEKQHYRDFVLEKYLAFLDGKQEKNEKASSDVNKNPEIDYYKLPRLDEAIKQTLKDKFSAREQDLKHLYHPSDIDIYPKAKYNKLEDPQPPSRAWKNPMAMRTMYELRKLINYLIEIGKIDRDTKIVVEMARQLNDANYRWAIETYQRRREDQNIEFAKAILGVAKEKYPELNENDADNIDKVRLWWEQLENGEELYKQIKALKEDVQKYRFWKEQECQCLYTGKMFNITDLFDGTKTQFEHTFPASISFDNSLDNLTVCDAWYNANIKKNQIPKKLGNYNKEWKGYTPIEPRLQNWIDKVTHLENLIDDNKLRTKKTQDPETKKDLIQKRHLLKFEFDYWNKKVKTFTLDEVPNSWKNSQLVDTQIISKYARAYLKTFFNKVDVQKGNIVSEFRKIFCIMGDEKKDRTKHSHHAIDAAVLTLISGSAKRDETLRRYYEAIENNHKYYEKPYHNFEISHVLNIEQKILINHVSKDQTLMHTKKKARKRGEIDFLKDKRTKQYLRDADGKKIPKWLKGDSIRGQLNEETYFGAIKVVERNENGFAIKENGKYKSTDEIWIVVRKPIENINFESDIIVDGVLGRRLKEQLSNGIKLNDVVDFQGNRIRHLRCRVKTGRGFQSKEKTIELRKHSHPSNQKHKKYVLSKIADNFLFLFYEKIAQEKYIRDARIISLFTFSELGFKSIEELINNDEWKFYKKNEDLILPLYKVIKAGQKVLFYEKYKEELKNLNINELKKRLFVVYKFNESLVSGKFYNYIFFKNHIEARPNPEIESEDLFDPTKYQSGLTLKPANMNCLLEGKDFEIHPDGKIKWINQ